jgi:hypothetical protein
MKVLKGFEIKYQSNLIIRHLLITKQNKKFTRRLKQMVRRDTFFSV